MNKINRGKRKIITSKKINMLGVLAIFIFLSIVSVQARQVIVDSAPQGATVYLGSTIGYQIIGVTPFVYGTPNQQTGLTFKKQYYGTNYGYVGPNSPDRVVVSLYYWGNDPGQPGVPPGWVFPSQTPTPSATPTPAPTPSATPTPTPESKPGSATINSIPSGADVYIRSGSGDIKVGVTPFVYPLPAQQTVLLFKKSGYLGRIAYISPSTVSPFVVPMIN